MARDATPSVAIHPPWASTLRRRPDLLLPAAGGHDLPDVLDDRPGRRGAEPGVRAARHDRVRAAGGVGGLARGVAAVTDPLLPAHRRARCADGAQERRSTGAPVDAPGRHRGRRTRRVAPRPRPPAVATPAVRGPGARPGGAMGENVPVTGTRHGLRTLGPVPVADRQACDARRDTRPHDVAAKEHQGEQDDQARGRSPGRPGQARRDEEGAAGQGAPHPPRPHHVRGDRDPAHRRRRRVHGLEGRLDPSDAWTRSRSTPSPATTRPSR